MAEIISREGEEITFQLKVKLSGSMLEMEEQIQDACNELGSAASVEALEHFDADGSPIVVGEIKLTSRTRSNKEYQTPYGEVSVERHVYQSSKGGRIYCPLEEKARIIRGATPRFAKQLTHKYTTLTAPGVCRDLEENHHRRVAHSYVQSVFEWVGSIAQAKEELWEYEAPKLEEAISTVVASLDGAYILMRDGQWREAMTGTFSLYDVDGERQHTVYIGASPEYGKAAFFERFERELKRIKAHYPEALYIGIADGAKQNWSFLEQHTERQLLDFFHVTEYLANVAYAAYPAKTGKPQRQAWLHQRCHQLKHESAAVEALIKEMHKLSRKTSLSNKVKEDLSAALTYFSNHRHMMDYASHIKQKLPIGSGVTEAACKTLVKQRLCNSGMRWKDKGVKLILSLRALVITKGRWTQFWNYINQYGSYAYS